MDNKEIRRLNLILLVDQHGGSVQALADATGTDATYLRNIRSRERNMGDEIARRLEDKHELERGWMDVPHANAPPAPPYKAQRETPFPQPTLSTTIDVPVFDVAASMGSGAAMPEHETVVGHMRLSREWVTRNITGTPNTRQLAVISAYGDSMQPTFTDGDILLVDRNVVSLRVDAVYVLEFHSELYIKRIQRRPDGSIAIISDNKVYEPIIVPATEKESVRVLGRVLWAWNGKRL